MHAPIRDHNMKMNEISFVLCLHVFKSLPLYIGLPCHTDASFRAAMTFERFRKAIIDNCHISELRWTFLGIDCVGITCERSFYNNKNVQRRGPAIKKLKNEVDIRTLILSDSVSKSKHARESE